MKLHPYKQYSVVKKIKIHTQPLREVHVQCTGRFLKETNHSLIFEGFRVCKKNVVQINEVKESNHE